MALLVASDNPRLSAASLINPAMFQKSARLQVLLVE